MKRQFNLAAIIIGLFLMSCKKQINEGISDRQDEKKSVIVVENGRMVFADATSFLNYIDELSKKSNEELIQEASRIPNFKSLLPHFNSIDSLGIKLSEQDESLKKFDFPTPYLLVLNEEGEIKVGDKIEWYRDGKKYFFPTQDEKEILTLKANPSAINDFIFTGSKLLEQPSNRNRTDIGIGGIVNAKHQKEFYQISYNGVPMAGNRKYVHEIITFFNAFVQNNVVMSYSDIDLRIKLEWKGKNWQPAGEKREISVNLQGEANISQELANLSYSIGPVISKVSYIEQSGDYLIPLARYGGPSDIRPLVWKLNLHGQIVHHVVGDVPENKWFNMGSLAYPLW